MDYKTNPGDGDGGDEHQREDTYFLPPGALPEGMAVNPGDVLEFKVVGKDKDGAIEVEYNHGDKKDEKGWEDDMRGEMANANPMAMEEQQ